MARLAAETEGSKGPKGYSGSRAGINEHDSGSAIRMAPNEGEAGSIDRASPRWFATAHWSVVLAARKDDSTEAAGTLEKLSGKPVLSRKKRNKTKEAERIMKTSCFISQVNGFDHI